MSKYDHDNEDRAYLAGLGAAIAFGLILLGIVIWNIVKAGP
jgi:hypothetical protein